MKREGPGAIPALFVYAQCMARRGDFLEGFLALHPAWMTLLWLMGGVALPITYSSAPSAPAMVAMWAVSAMVPLWCFAVYRVSVRRLNQKPIREYDIICAVVALGFVAAPVWLLFANISGDETYQLFVSPVPRGFEIVRFLLDGFLTLFILCGLATAWIAAMSLVTFERKRATLEQEHTVWMTVLLLSLFPFGVWALSPRVRRMLAN
ncbi:MAG: hypothetical protein AB7J28_16390 [Hyphomonadaceae bacterium]